MSGRYRGQLISGMVERIWNKAAEGLAYGDEPKWASAFRWRFRAGTDFPNLSRLLDESW